MSNEDILKEIGVDTEILFDRFCGNAALAYKFLKKLPDDPNYVTLATAVGKRDSKGIEMAAHTLKGLCANLELRELSAIAAEIVVEIRAGRFDRLDELFETFRTHYEKTCETLRRLV